MNESMMEKALKESCKIELQAVIDERQKWIKAINDIANYVHNYVILSESEEEKLMAFIDKHTKEVM